MREEDGTVLVGWYHLGRLGTGPVWLVYPDREGALYTYLEDSHARLSRAVFTGDRVAWLYPDYSTGLVGKFVAGTMLGAAEAVLEQDGDENGIPKMKTILVNPEKTFTFDPSTDTHLSATPLVRDPYERKLLHVETSRIPGAGVGVFTLVPLKKYSIIGYFNGIHRHRGEVR